MESHGAGEPGGCIQGGSDMGQSSWRRAQGRGAGIILLLTAPSSVPSQPPENVRAISITSDVAVISWSEPPRSTLNGVLKGYRVIFWSLYMDGGERPRGTGRHAGGDGAGLTGAVPAEWGEMQNITTTRERVELRGMEKFTNYSVQVLAYTQAGDGVRSSVLYIQTKEDSEWHCPWGFPLGSREWDCSWGAAVGSGAARLPKNPWHAVLCVN